MRGVPRRLRRALFVAALALPGGVATLPAAPAAATAAETGPLLVELRESCAFLLRGEPTALRVNVHSRTSQHLGPVTLTPELPPGFTATVGPAPAPLPAWRTRTFRVVVTAPASAPAGPATLRFVATAAGATAALTVTQQVVDVPAAPTAVAATAGDRTASVTWTPGAWTGFPRPADDPHRAPVYVVTATPGGATTTVRGASSARVAGLANGTAYTFTVTAINEFGRTASAPTAPVVPAGVPGVVPDVTATGTGSSRVVSWGVPDANGSPLTGYTVTAHPGGATVAAPADATSADVTGLDASTDYAFTVRAANAVGAGEDSPLADGRPLALAADVTVEGEWGAAVWIAGTAGDGPAVDGWLVRFEPSGTEVQVPKETSEHHPHGYGSAFDMDPLPGTTVAVTIRPVNAVGQGPATRFAPVTTRQDNPPNPDPVGVVAGDGEIQVCFAAGWDHGAGTTGYAVTFDDHRVRSVALDERVVRIPAENWVDRMVNVVAVGDRGESPPWVPSTLVRPETAAGAPPPVTVSANSRNVDLAWRYETEPAWGWNGYFEIVAAPGGDTKYVPHGDLGTWFGDLTNGTAYTFTVRTVDTNGYGAPYVTEPVVPMGAPLPVSEVTVTAKPGDPATAVVRWTPADPNGSPLTRYDVLLGDTVVAQAGPAATSAEVAGLDYGTDYVFAVTATNAVGTSSATLAKTAYRPDRTPPVLTVTPPAPATLSGPARISYAASDAASYDVRYRAVRPDGTAGPYRYPATWQATTALTRGVAVQPGTAVCFGVRARDAAGNVTPWSAAACTAAPLDDAALRASAGWTRGTGTAFYRGTYSSARSAGATLSLPDVRARRLVLVAATCAACGDVGIFVDGVLVGRMSLSSPTTAYRQVVSLDLSSVRSGTLALRSMSGRAYVDGLAILPV